MTKNSKSASKTSSALMLPQRMTKTSNLPCTLKNHDGQNLEIHLPKNIVEIRILYFLFHCWMFQSLLYVIYFRCGEYMHQTGAAIVRVPKKLGLP